MAPGQNELEAMQKAFGALEPLSPDERHRAVQWLLGALGIKGAGSEEGAPAEGNGAGSAGSGLGQGKTPTPREFIAQKKPGSAVDRIACLAYYLTKYRKTKTFKTKQLTALNTEAAARKFANTSRDVSNADRQNGYLVAAGAGSKQLTVRGEALVEALPDREAAKAALAAQPFKRRRSPASPQKKPKAAKQ